MATPLFEFDDDFIAAMAGGLSDDDTLDLIASGLQGMGNEMARAIAASSDDEYPVVWNGSEWVIELDEAGVVEEFGSATDGVAPPMRISTGVQRSRLAAERAFEEVLSGHDS